MGTILIGFLQHTKYIFFYKYKTFKLNLTSPSWWIMPALYCVHRSFGRRNSKDLTDQNIVLGPILFCFYKIFLESTLKFFFERSLQILFECSFFIWQFQKVSIEVWIQHLQFHTINVNWRYCQFDLIRY